MGNVACVSAASSSDTPHVPIAVVDFETTGLSPAMGDRATEIAIVLVEGEREVGRY